MSCHWPIDRGCLPDIPESGEDRVKLQAAVDTAVQVLWSLTGQVFGCCPVIARPCSSREMRLAGFRWYPVFDAGVWRNHVCSCGAGPCAAAGPAVVHLPGPVCSILEVKIGTDVQAPETYVLENDRLYRRVGEWPGQNYSKPLGEPGTWSISYERGVPPPEGAARAVSSLAVEFWNACTTGKCRLPRGTVTVQRQGVTVQMVDPREVLDRGVTGLPEVDMWVASVNPYRHRAQPVVWSPDYGG